jgi:hypothetical protein
VTAQALAPVTLDTSRGRWTIAAKHTAPDGDIDVVLAFRPHACPAKRCLYGYRHTAVTGWRQVAGGFGYWVGPAVRAIAAESETWPIAHAALLPLLAVASELPDQPATPGGDQ